MVYDFSKLAPAAAIQFDTDDQCVDLIRSADPSQTYESLRQLLDRIHCHPGVPYAIDITISSHGGYNWCWCDVEWYKDNGYTIYHVSEIPRIGEIHTIEEEDLSALEFELL